MIKPIVVIRFALMFLLGIPFISRGLQLFSSFPHSYTWSELLINYQGGFVRRGLLGEIAYQLNGVIPARFFLAIVPVVLYLAIIWFIVNRGKITFINIVFVLSPATILFPIYDFEAFARKDVLIISAFFLCVHLSEHIRNLNMALFFTMITYGVLGLIVETAWFYFPLASAIIILNVNDSGIEDRSKYWAESFFFLVSCFVFISIVNNLNFNKGNIIRSWHLLYPTLQFGWGGRGAISLLGLSLNTGLEITLSSISYISTLKGYTFSFLLANIPTIYILLNYKFKFYYKHCKLGITWSFAVMLCSFAFAADWGRCIYLFTIHTFVFLIIISNNNEDVDDIKVVDEYPKRFLFATIKATTVLVYATSWQLQHWVPGGESALQAGPLLSFIKDFVSIVRQN